LGSEQRACEDGLKAKIDDELAYQRNSQIQDTSLSGKTLYDVQIVTRNPAIAEGPRDAGVPVEIW